MNQSLFSCVPAVAERLRSEVGGKQFTLGDVFLDPVIFIDSASMLTGAATLVPYCPGLVISLDAMSTGSFSASGSVMQEDRVVIVSVVVRNVPSQGDVSTESVAGVYALAVIMALKGWCPGDKHGPMRYVGCEAPGFYKSGTAEFPLIFHVSQTLTP
jgi:hypothetical protein